METKRLLLKRWVRDQDLREITHLGLAAKAQRMKIREGEMVLFTNASLSRARAIIMSDGLPLLILFPAESGYQVLSRLVVEALAWTTRNADGSSEVARLLVGRSASIVKVLRAA